MNLAYIAGFNTQPPEGGWVRASGRRANLAEVSTHSRPKAAGPDRIKQRRRRGFQHTAARRRLASFLWVGRLIHYCFNTQPPEGGWKIIPNLPIPEGVSTHSRPKAAGDVDGVYRLHQLAFQHTAARRRLVSTSFLIFFRSDVSTHSRPKAAGKYPSISKLVKRFQHTAARRRLGLNITSSVWELISFQHTAARRRLGGLPSSPLRTVCFNTQPPEGGWKPRF